MLRDSRKVALATLIFLVAVATYANTLGHGFVFDDHQNIVANRWIRDVRSIPEIFGTHAAGFDPKYATSYYRPLVHLLSMGVYHIAGLTPAAFHALNVLLHGLNSVLAFLVVWALGRRPPHGFVHPTFVALVAGALFAVHVIHTEAVAWVAGLSDLSFSFFVLLAVLDHMRAEGRGVLRHARPALLFFLGTLCKETALFVIPIFVLYERARAPSDTPRDLGSRVRPLLPLGFATLVYLLLRIGALGALAPSLRVAPEGTTTNLLSAVHLVFAYLRRLLVPIELNALHPYAPVESLADPRLLAGLGAAAAVAAAAWRLRDRPLALFGVAFATLPLLPVLYVPALGEGVPAERYLYVPVLGFGILIGLIADRLASGGSRRWARASVLAVVLLSLAGHAAATVARNRIWRDDLSLWTDTAAKSPDSAVAQEYLCFAQYAANRFREAADSCTRALRIDPERTDARTNLATALSVLGDLDGAVREFREVLHRRPESAEALTNLGLVYMAKGDPDLAIRSYREALRHNPHYAEAHNDLGVALAMTGRPTAAIASLAEAVRLAPDRAEYAANLVAARRAAAETGRSTSGPAD